jgi:hypothetical protein
LENGRHAAFVRRLWPARSSGQLNSHVGDTQKANGELLPVCRHHLKKMAADHQDGVLSFTPATYKTQSEYYSQFGIRHLGKRPPQVLGAPQAHGKSVPSAVPTATKAATLPRMIQPIYSTYDV